MRSSLVLRRLRCDTIANNPQRPVELSPPVLSHRLQPNDHGLEIAAIHVAPNGASPLALRHQIVQRMMESAVAVGQFDVDVDAAAREVGGEALIDGTLPQSTSKGALPTLRAATDTSVRGPSTMGPTGAGPVEHVETRPPWSPAPPPTTRRTSADCGQCPRSSPESSSRYSYCRTDR
jgi:hypothetical protein